MFEGAPGEGYATNDPDLEETVKKRPGHAGIADMPQHD
jgi:hypothetical protein